MQFHPRLHSSFWDTISFEEAEVDVFFPKTKNRPCRLKNGNLNFIDPKHRVLRQDVYEWCLDQFGPEFYMDTALDRVYYVADDVPDLTIKATLKLLEKRYLVHRWCIVDHRGLAFTDAKDAMLFKLTWSARGTP